MGSFIRAARTAARNINQGMARGPVERSTGLYSFSRWHLAAGITAAMLR